MKSKNLYIPLVLLFLLSACKKEYTCTCTNPGGKVKAFSVKDSKKNAESKCSKYYDDNFGSIPLNETNCAIE